MHTYMHMYACICMHMYVCVYIYIFIYMQPPPLPRPVLGVILRERLLCHALTLNLDSNPLDSASPFQRSLRTLNTVTTPGVAKPDRKPKKKEIYTKLLRRQTFWPTAAFAKQLHHPRHSGRGYGSAMYVLNCLLEVPMRLI